MFLVCLSQLPFVAALFVAIDGAGNHDQIFTVNPIKGSRCHYPAISNCNSSLYPILDFQLSAWFYHAPFKSCRPLYTAGGMHNCARNQDLPLTKQQCEDLCGEPCKTGNGSDGICMMEEYCKPTVEKATAHPRPCGAYNVKCCPRSDPAPNAAAEASVPNSVATNTIAERDDTESHAISVKRRLSAGFRGAAGNDPRSVLEHTP